MNLHSINVYVLQMIFYKGAKDTHLGKDTLFN
jgi:hypothetical protein